MSLAERLREIVLYSLTEFKLIEGTVWQNFRWQQPEVSFLNFCLTQGHLSQTDFRTAVRNRILSYAEVMHKQTSKRDSWVYADHVTSPHALAYAIQEQHFDAGALRQIRFDHGDTVSSFMSGRVTTLVEEIMQQLRGIPIAARAYEIDDHPLHNIII